MPIARRSVAVSKTVGNNTSITAILSDVKAGDAVVAFLCLTGNSNTGNLPYDDGSLPTSGGNITFNQAASGSINNGITGQKGYIRTYAGRASADATNLSITFAGIVPDGNLDHTQFIVMAYSGARFKSVSNPVRFNASTPGSTANQTTTPTLPSLTVNPGAPSDLMVGAIFAMNSSTVGAITPAAPITEVTTQNYNGANKYSKVLIGERPTTVESTGEPFNSTATLSQWITTAFVLASADVANTAAVIDNTKIKQRASGVTMAGTGTAAVQCIVPEVKKGDLLLLYCGAPTTNTSQAPVPSTIVCNQGSFAVQRGIQAGAAGGAKGYSLSLWFFIATADATDLVITMTPNTVAATQEHWHIRCTPFVNVDPLVPVRGGFAPAKANQTTGSAAYNFDASPAIVTTAGDLFYTVALNFNGQPAMVVNAAAGYLADPLTTKVNAYATPTQMAALRKGIATGATESVAQWTNTSPEWAMINVTLIPMKAVLTAVADNVAPYLHAYSGYGSAFTRLTDPATPLPTTFSRAIAVNITTGHIAYALSSGTTDNLKIYDGTGTQLVLVKSITSVIGALSAEYTIDGKYLLVAGNSNGANTNNHGLAVYDVANNYALLPYSGTVLDSCAVAVWNHKGGGATGDYKLWAHRANGASYSMVPYTIVSGVLTRGAAEVALVGNITNIARSTTPGDTTTPYVWGATPGGGLLRFTLDNSGQTLTATNSINSGFGSNDSLAPALNDSVTFDRIGVVGTDAPRFRNYQASTANTPSPSNPPSPPANRPFGIGPDPSGLGYIMGNGNADGTLLRYDYVNGYVGTYMTGAGQYANRIATANLKVPVAPPYVPPPQPQICTVQ